MKRTYTYSIDGELMQFTEDELGTTLRAFRKAGKRVEIISCSAFDKAEYEKRCGLSQAALREEREAHIANRYIK